MARKAAIVRKGKVRTAKDADDASTEVEVEEETTVEVKPAMGLETALIGITFIALIAAFLMIQMKMHAAFGKGWPV